MPQPCGVRPQRCGGGPQSCGGAPKRCGVRPKRCGGRPQRCGGGPQSCGGAPQSCGGRPQRCGGRPKRCGGGPKRCGVREKRCGVRPKRCGGGPHSRALSPLFAEPLPDATDAAVALVRTPWPPESIAGSWSPEGLKSFGSRDLRSLRATLLRAPLRSFGGVPILRLRSDARTLLRFREAAPRLLRYRTPGFPADCEGSRRWTPCVRPARTPRSGRRLPELRRFPRSRA